MPEFDLAIRGGTVVTAADTFRADIGIRDGRIAAVAEKVEGARPRDRRLGASGAAGRDRQPRPLRPARRARTSCRRTTSPRAPRAAAAGGNTCVLPFALQVKGTSLRECVEEYRRKAEGQCYIDVGFHLIITHPTPEVLGQELPALVKAGHTSFKVFMTYDDLVLNDRELLEVFEVARRERALVMVHAEGYDAIRFMTERLERAGKTAPFYHAASRPQVVEREATHRAISHAELVDVPIMIVHVSGREAMEQIRWARQRGLKVYAETCPQYITLTAERPARRRHGHERRANMSARRRRATARATRAIWEGIEHGRVPDLLLRPLPVPLRRPEGQAHTQGTHLVPLGAERHSRRRDAPADPVLRRRRRRAASRSIASSSSPSTNHAKIYGLYPRKGSIAVGFDADIALWDPNRKETIRQEILHHGSDYTPWEGFEVTGWPVMTIARGEVVAEEGRIVGRKGRGEILEREISPYAAAPA